VDEVRLAVEKGYSTLDIYEISENEMKQYNPERGEGGLFVEYIKKF